MDNDQCSILNMKLETAEDYSHMVTAGIEKYGTMAVWKASEEYKLIQPTINRIKLVEEYKNALETSSMRPGWGAVALACFVMYMGMLALSEWCSVTDMALGGIILFIIVTGIFSIPEINW